MKAVSEAVLKQAFAEVFNEIKINKEEIFGTVAANIEKVLKSRTDVQQIEKMDSEIEVLKEQLKSLGQLKTKDQLDAEIFNALLDKIEIISKTYFCFVLKMGLE